MTLKGDLGTVGLTTILQLLESDSKTGLLQIISEDNIAGLFLKDGGIAYATCSQSDSRLGYLLRSSGVITDEELEIHLALSKETNRALGKVLVYEKTMQEHGYVKDKGAWYAPDEYETLMISRGFYKYEDDYLNQDRFEKEVLVPVLRNKCKLEDWQKIDRVDVKIKRSNGDEIAYEIMGVAIASLKDYRVVVTMSVDATFNKKMITGVFPTPKKTHL